MCRWRAPSRPEVTRRPGVSPACGHGQRHRRREDHQHGHAVRRRYAGPASLSPRTVRGAPAPAGSCAELHERCRGPELSSGSPFRGVRRARPAPNDRYSRREAGGGRREGYRRPSRTAPTTASATSALVLSQRSPIRSGCGRRRRGPRPSIVSPTPHPRCGWRRSHRLAPRRPAVAQAAPPPARAGRGGVARVHPGAQAGPDSAAAQRPRARGERHRAQTRRLRGGPRGDHTRAPRPRGRR